MFIVLKAQAQRAARRVARFLWPVGQRLTGILMSQDDPSGCNKVLDERVKDVYFIDKNFDLNILIAEYLEMNRDQFINHTDTRSSNIKAVYKAFATTFTSNKSKQRVEDIKERYKKGGLSIITESERVWMYKEAFQEKVFDAWQKCKEAYFISLGIQGKGLSATIEGDKAAEFIFILNWSPVSKDDVSSTTITSIDYTSSVKPLPPIRIFDGVVIETFTGLTQKFERIKKNQLATITVNFKDWLPVNVKLEAIPDEPPPPPPPPPPPLKEVEIRAVDFNRRDGIEANTALCEILCIHNILNPNIARPNMAEYNIPFERKGFYKIFIEYAAAQSRPVEIRLNGKLVRGDGLSIVTGDWCNFQWHEQVIVEVIQGNNTLNLYRSNVFPHIKTIKFEPINN